MVQDKVVIDTSISSSILKRTLLKGAAIASLGALIVIFSGSFLPLSLMKEWGFILFLFAMILVTAGLLPYRKMAKLQANPNQFILLDPNHAAFIVKGKKLLTLPLSCVKRSEYIEDNGVYGIALWLNPPSSEPIIVHGQPHEIEKIRFNRFFKGEGDLFFPYFNKTAYHEWIEWLKAHSELYHGDE